MLKNNVNLPQSRRSTLGLLIVPSKAEFVQSDLRRLIATFGNMERDGFDTKNHLKWGFFFVNRTPENLNALFNELQGHNYNFEYLRKLEDDSWMLYVTKVEILSPEKLHKRNIAFNELAEYCEVLEYDGWDVERINAD